MRRLFLLAAAVAFAAPSTADAQRAQLDALDVLRTRQLAQVGFDVEFYKHAKTIPVGFAEEVCSFWVSCGLVVQEYCNELLSALRQGCAYYYEVHVDLDHDIPVLEAAVTTPAGLIIPLLPCGPNEMCMPDDFVLVYPCLDDLKADFPPGIYSADIEYEDPNQVPRQLQSTLGDYDSSSFPDVAPLSVADVDPDVANSVTVEWGTLPGVESYELDASCDPGLCEYETELDNPDPGIYLWEVPWNLAAAGACLIEIEDSDHQADLPDFKFRVVRPVAMDERDGDGIPYYEGPPACATGETADCVDNCPNLWNADQADLDENGIGDACQCGDVNGDGVTNVSDALSIARGEVLSTDPHFPRCDVDGDGVCNVRDALAIARGEVGSAHQDQLCPAYTGD